MKPYFYTLVQEHFRNIRNEIKKDIWSVCFSENGCNETLWLKYAEQHKGFAVEFLAKNAGQVFSRQQIINAVKGSDYPVTARAIDVQILGIRKKLEQFNTSDFNVSDLICTIRGIGYRMQEDKNSDA